MKSRTKNKMKPTPYNVQGKTQDFSKHRTSKVGLESVATGSAAILFQPPFQIMYENSKNPVVRKITRRLELALGMDSLNKTMFDSENFQLMNYGVGGKISGHLDSYGVRPGLTGQEGFDHGGPRFCTFMIYLSPVNAGGHTVFQQLNVWNKPVFGDALFWFNIDSEGLPDTRIYHSGCPVIHGNKWIANKWINWLSQMWTYPCLVDKGAPYKPFTT